MLHAGLLAFHEAWAGFLARLRYVVIDELHTYSGVFGTHVLHLLRRLNRVCAAYGSRPAYMTSSATIGNPDYLAGTLVNRPFHTVSENGAPAAARHVVFVNPVESPQALAARLLRLSVRSGLRTIVFTRGAGHHRTHLPLGHAAASRIARGDLFVPRRLPAGGTAPD